MKATTLPPEHAALVAAKVQTIITFARKPKVTAGDRLAIHAGTRLPKHDDPDGNGCRRLGDWQPVHGYGYSEVPLVAHRDWESMGDNGLLFMHPGHIVASARVCDVVPIVLYPDSVGDAACIENSDMLVHWKAGENDEYADTLIDDQLPLADFTPGRWAVLLDDVAATTGRCPACWGTWAPCRVCFTQNGYVGGAGTCPPIPWRGRPGIWEVTW